ncbi:MAG TPA: condensation domain-containing protein, partial [Longimicrobiaceae bacterium]|nr:condensation domain-containing protein [Longimicrobiaceae bacterium]
MRTPEQTSQSGLAPVPPPAEDDVFVFPLSFAQERLWFLEQLEPGTALYNIPLATRLSGALDVPALERAFGEIVRRHEALRTTFRAVEGAAVQVVHPPREVKLTVEDLTGAPPEERDAVVGHIAREEGLRPFDLVRGPLFRVRLLRLDREEHALLVTMHHIVSDGWSVGVLDRELAVLYGAFARGEPSPLPNPEIQYADFALWQRERLRGEVLDRLIAYWRDRLAGAPTVLELPVDHPRPAVPRRRGAAEAVALDPELSGRLRSLARREGATLYMVLLAAWSALLSRYSGEEDVVVGAPVAGRTRGEVEPLIGFFVNTLALRTDLSGDPCFRELLARVRQATLTAYEHQELPFERLVGELAPERSLAHTPLFQVLLSLQEEQPAPTFPGLRAWPLEVEHGMAKFDLSLRAADRAEGLRFSLQYATELFEGATVRRMLGHLRTFLEAVATHPERRLSDTPLLSEAERGQVIEEWNRTGAEHPHALVHELFSEQAGRTPDAVALVSGPERLTYARLERRANRLAHLLRRRGVAPEVRVGVCLERSPDLIVSLLAV